MTEKPGNTAPRSVTSVWPALVVMAFGLGILLWAQNYSPTARRFPSVVAGIIVILGLIDLWSRLPLPGQNLIRDFWGTAFDRREMSHDPDFGDEVVMLFWVIAAFAGMAVVGVLVALPIFCLAFTRLKARRPLIQSIIVAVVVLGFEYTVFEWLLDYELYRGLLFSKGGFAKW
jgi:hypothetical protein